MMKNILIITSIIFPLVSAASFQGDYLCKGNDLENNTPYELIISFEKSKETYKLTCKYENVLYYGTAFYDSKTHSLPAVLVNPQNYHDTTLIVFHPQKNAHLNATWTYFAKASLAHAECKKQ